MPSMESVLNTKASEVKRPPPLPVSNYTLQLHGRPNFVDMERQGKSSYVDFQSKIMGISEDTSDEDLAAYPGGRAVIMGMDVKPRHGWCRFYLSEGALPQLTEWLHDVLGIDLEGKSLKEACFEVPGHMAIAEVQQTPTQDGKGMIAEIRGWARA